MLEVGIRRSLQPRVRLHRGTQIDIRVEPEWIVEIKSVGKIEEVDEAQPLTSIKWARVRFGWRINVCGIPLKEGIKRFVFFVLLCGRLIVGIDSVG